jgi:hypothetical protein
MSHITEAAIGRLASRLENHRESILYLAHPATAHVGRTDFGRSWACGYYNTTMLCSAIQVMLPDSHSTENHQSLAEKKIEGDQVSKSLQPCQTFPNKLITVDFLQKQLEDAWKDGWDPDGAKHYGHVLQGRREWIGAVEVLVFLYSLNVHGQLIQFRASPAREHPARQLVAWVQQYFESYVGQQAVMHILSMSLSNLYQL